jgi:hypothetical protein
LAGDVRGGTIADSEVGGVISNVGGKVGGLVGRIENGQVIESTSEVEIQNARGSGGLVGTIGFDAEVRSSNAVVKLDSVTNFSGGLVGVNEGRVVRSHVTKSRVVGTDEATGGAKLGGLVGLNEGEITDSKAGGMVVANNDNSFAGGLVGQNTGVIEESTFAGGVRASERAGSVGGLVASNKGDAKILRSGSSASITVISHPDGPPSSLGGLVGSSLGMVSRSRASGDLTIVGESPEGSGGQAGGLVGSMAFGAVVRKSYTSVSIEVGERRYTTGGLIGEASTDPDGGISKSYAAGLISADNVLPSRSVVGSGRKVELSSLFWDRNKYNQVNGSAPDSSGVTGLTTSEMQGTEAKINMSGFDFDSTWRTVSGDYPVLRWEEE